MLVVNWLTYSIKWCFYRLDGAFRVRRFIHLAKKPRQLQLALLKRILRDNNESQVGRGYRFQSIADVQQYQSYVGIATYEDIRERLRVQESSGQHLLCTQPFVHVNCGDQGVDDKAFPFTADALSDFRRDTELAAHVWSKSYSLWRGRIFAMLADEHESVSTTGLHQCTVSGLMFRCLPRFVRRHCYIPNQVSSIRNPQDRYLALAILGLAESNVTCMLTANPAVFGQLLHTIEAHFEEICKSIELGVVPTNLRQGAIPLPNFRPNPKRASQLRALVKEGSPLHFGNLWPHLKGVICWTGGNCRIALAALRSVLPAGLPIYELGYQSRVGIYTLNVDAKSNTCLPILHRIFFEFAERTSWEAGFAQLKLLDEIVVGQEYYMLVTTKSGLYRLQTDQIVRVTGKIHDTPTLEFIQNSSNHVNMRGERLTETQVIDAVEHINEAHGVGIDRFMLVGDIENRRYDLYVESGRNWETELVEQQFNDALTERNPRWAVKRMTEQLQAPKVHRIKVGTIDAFRTGQTRDGFTDPLLVLQHVHNRDQLELDLDAARIDASQVS